MVVISKSKLYSFVDVYSDLKEAIEKWYSVVSKADWNNLSDIKHDFNNVDFVRNDRYVFNLKGKKFRLVVMIHCSIRTVYIRYIGTHSEYDKIDCSTI